MTSRTKGRAPAGEEDRGRADLAAACLELYDQGLLTPRGGNLSVLLPGGLRILITPSGLHKGRLRPGDMIAIGRNGRPVEPSPAGTGPSTESPVHVATYRARPDARAIIHAHPPHATALATLGLCIEPVTVEAAAYSGTPALPYLPPGSPALARRVAQALAGHDFVLLAGHGAFAIGASLDQAAAGLVGLERACRDYLLIRQHAGGKDLALIPGGDEPDPSGAPGRGGQRTGRG